MGRHVLSEDDIRAGRRFDDAIATGCWYFDVHPNKTTLGGANDFAPEKHQPDPYDIPFASLVPRHRHSDGDGRGGWNGRGPRVGRFHHDAITTRARSSPSRRGGREFEDAPGGQSRQLRMLVDQVVGGAIVFPGAEVAGQASGFRRLVHLHGAGAEAAAVVVELHVRMVGEQ